MNTPVFQGTPDLSKVEPPFVIVRGTASLANNSSSTIEVYKRQNDSFGGLMSLSDEAECVNGFDTGAFVGAAIR